MISNQWTWKSKDGVEMFSRSWEPDGAPKAVVNFVHGLGEHSGRHAHTGKALTDAGFALLALDQRGHGQSGGQRGHFPSFEAAMDDIHQHIRQGSEKFPGLPIFLYGHSMGGLLVLNYATYYKHSLSGLIVTGAGLRSPVLEQKAKLTLAKVLGGLLPTLTIPTGLETSALSRDPEVVRIYKQDPLVHGVATLSTTVHLGIFAVERVFAHAAEFPVPLLLMHGAADSLTYPRGSQEFAGLVPGDCTLKLWDGLYHEIHNEPEQDEVFAFMIGWMNSQLRNK